MTKSFGAFNHFFFFLHILIKKCRNRNALRFLTLTSPYILHASLFLGIFFSSKPHRPRFIGTGFDSRVLKNRLLFWESIPSLAPDTTESREVTCLVCDEEEELL